MRASATGSGTATWSRPWRRSRGWAPPTAPSRCGARAAGRWRLGDENHMGMDLMVILGDFMVFFLGDFKYFLGIPLKIPTASGCTKGFCCRAILGAHDPEVWDVLEGYFGAIVPCIKKHPTRQRHHANWREDDFERLYGPVILWDFIGI